MYLNVTVLQLYHQNVRKHILAFLMQCIIATGTRLFSIMARLFPTRIRLFATRTHFIVTMTRLLATTTRLLAMTIRLFTTTTRLFTTTTRLLATTTRLFATTTRLFTTTTRLLATTTRLFTTTTRLLATTTRLLATTTRLFATTTRLLATPRNPFRLARCRSTSTSANAPLRRPCDARNRLYLPTSGTLPYRTSRTLVSPRSPLEVVPTSSAGRLTSTTCSPISKRPTSIIQTTIMRISFRTRTPILLPGTTRNVYVTDVTIK